MDLWTSPSDRREPCGPCGRDRGQRIRVAHRLAHKLHRTNHQRSGEENPEFERTLTPITGNEYDYPESITVPVHFIPALGLSKQPKSPHTEYMEINMSSKRKRTTQKRVSKVEETVRDGRAPQHKELHSKQVHVFVDDQNLFWGIVNHQYGRGFRIDFGLLLTRASRDTTGNTRFVKSAYIAGVIPDDDSFWQIAKNQGFTVRRGFLGSNNRSKQDDAYLITDLTATLYEQEGPSTIILVAGDADYVPPLQKSIDKGWRNEVAFIDRGVSEALEPVVHEFRVISPSSIEYVPSR